MTIRKRIGPFVITTTRKAEGERRAALARIPSGYLYLIHATRSGAYKIGTTLAPNRRVKQITSNRSEPCEIVYVTPGEVFWNRRKEAALLSKYRARKISGEWFGLDVSDVARVVADIVALEHETEVSGGR